MTEVTRAVIRKTMPKKPTRPYGWLAFSRDGKVRKEMFQLPDDKSGQEKEVANAFLPLAASLASAGVPTGARVQMLPENDHDLRILHADNEVHATVQIAEVTLRSYTRQLSQEEYDRGTFRQVILNGPDKYLAVDPVKFAEAVAIVVKGKLKKNYARPRTGELWLLIFSVSGHLLGSAWHAGEWVVSEPIREARRLLAETGAGPFDKILFFNMTARPEFIWPPLDDRSEQTAPK